MDKKKILAAAIASTVGFGAFTMSLSYIDVDTVVSEYKNTVNGDFWQKTLTVTGGNSNNTAGSNKQENKDSGVKTESGNMNASPETKEVIAMNDEDFWNLISEGRYKSYEEASTDYNTNRTQAHSFWEGVVTSVEVPVWKWSDASKTQKVESKVSITVNKHLTSFWVDFFTDLHNLPEKYVMISIGGFSVRSKNNGSANPGMSSHSFGTTVDINPDSKGMGSRPAGIGDGIPWADINKVPEPLKSEVCALNSDWFELAKSYNLNWGGLWTPGSQDPMHFSIVGDGAKKNEVNYNMRGDTQ